MAYITDDVDQLQKFLASLMAQNVEDIDRWVSDGTLWKSLPISHLSAKETMSRISEMQSTLQVLFGGLERTKAVLDLKGLGPSGSTKKDCSQKACQGILSLPNEILCMIARKIYCQGNLNVIRLSHTCNTLRNVVLSCPELWTKISSGASDFYVEACLSRSQELPLDIHVGIGDPISANKRPAWRNFTTHILRHSHRWNSFHIDITVYDSPTISLFAQLSQGALSLPKLQSLVINQGYRDDDDDETLLLDDNFHFYSSWTMPNLSKFTFANFIPRAVLPPTTTIITAEYTDIYELNTALLLDFLRSNPQIRHLSLELADCELEQSGSLVVLDNVELFSVKIRLNDVDYTSHLMQHIQLPNVEEFRIDMDSIFEPVQVNLAVESLLSGHEQFDKITKFELKITRMRPQHEEYNTGKFLSKLPNLKALSIDAWYEEYSEEFFWDPELRAVGKLPELDRVDLNLDGHFYHENIALELMNVTKVGRLNLHYSPPFDPNSIERRSGDTNFTWGFTKRIDEPL